MEHIGKKIISIITVNYNGGKFLENTIKSVISQNYSLAEHIIIDGGSTDNSIDIIKKYEKQITYWISEKDKGQSDAINKGLKKASGDIVGWLNSDDLYYADTFRTVEKIFHKNPDVDLIYGDVENFYEDGRKEIIKNEFEPVDFLSRISIHQPSVFWKRKIHDEIGYLDGSLHCCMDYDLWMRIFLNYRTFKINKTLSKFRVHAQSKTSSNPKEMYIEYRKILSRFFNSVFQDSISQLEELKIYNNPENLKYKIAYQFSKSDLNKILHNYIWECAVQEYTWKNKKQAHKLFSRNLFNKPVKSIFFLTKNRLR